VRFFTGSDSGVGFRHFTTLINTLPFDWFSVGVTELALCDFSSSFVVELTQHTRSVEDGGKAGGTWQCVYLNTSSKRIGIKKGNKSQVPLNRNLDNIENSALFAIMSPQHSLPLCRLSTLCHDVASGRGSAHDV
jgi:hypothetical protein